MSEDIILWFDAKHDLELAHILNNYYVNYHFRERIEKEDVIFDYKLYEGFSKTKNAIKLLNMLGYDKKIVTDAADMARAFEKNNSWEQITF